MRFSILIVKVLISFSLCILLQLLHISCADAQSLTTDRAEAPATSQLVGTVESSPFSGAVFDDGTGNQSFYRLHDTLPDGSQIIRIGSESIRVKRTDGEVYEMFVTGGKRSGAIPAPPAGANPVRQYSTPPGSATTNTPLPPGRRDRNRRIGRDG